ncbi:MAG TPA: O-acetyl-ADP-ribose deacetylase [Chloroflexota bacterium]|nr:O-acetyl-ADP-ribose deacetylase [Chloroflexota bacterium]
MESLGVGNTVLRLIQGDITQVDADAIVNAANPSLLGGGGVDGAIHRAAGPALREECARLGGCPPGDARITRAGRLPMRYVIHAVGPIWRGGRAGEPELLARAYRRALELADAHGVQRLAFPSISTGAYGYPEREAARVALRTVRDYLRDTPTGLREVIFVLFSPGTLANYAAALAELAAPTTGAGDLSAPPLAQEERNESTGQGTQLA